MTTKFTGKKRDVETGLDYFGARYYSNGLGRWLSADWSATPVPVQYADFADPQSLNLYGYVRGFPTTSADLDGHGCPSVCEPEVNLDFAKQTLKQLKPSVLKALGKQLAKAGPIALLAAPPVVAAGFAAVVGPIIPPDNNCSGPYCDMSGAPHRTSV